MGRRKAGESWTRSAKASLRVLSGQRPDCGEGISHAGQVNNAQGRLKSGKTDLSERTSGEDRKPLEH